MILTAILSTALMSCSDELDMRVYALAMQGYSPAGVFDDGRVRNLTLRLEGAEHVEFIGMATTADPNVARQLRADGWVLNDSRCTEGTEIRSLFVKYRKVKSKA